MNPKGNHPSFPTLPNGKRDVDHAWDLKDTWKQMEAVLKKGACLSCLLFLGIRGGGGLECMVVTCGATALMRRRFQ